MPGTRFTDTDTPTAIDGVEIAVFEGEAVLFDEASSMLHRLGAIAGAVWLCCDGSTDVAGIVTELASVFDLEPAELEPVVYETLERFADEGLLVDHDTTARLTADVVEPSTSRISADDGTGILTRPPDP